MTSALTSFPMKISWRRSLSRKSDWQVPKFWNYSINRCVLHVYFPISFCFRFISPIVWFSQHCLGDRVKGIYLHHHKCIEQLPFLVFLCCEQFHLIIQGSTSCSLDHNQVLNVHYLKPTKYHWSNTHYTVTLVLFYLLTHCNSHRCTCPSQGCLSAEPQGPITYDVSYQEGGGGRAISVFFFFSEWGGGFM